MKTKILILVIIAAIIVILSGLVYYSVRDNNMLYLAIAITTAAVIFPFIRKLLSHRDHL